MNELGSTFEVEEGNGQERDEVLAKHNVETFLIICPPPTTNTSNSTKGVTIILCIGIN